MTAASEPLVAVRELTAGYRGLLRRRPVLADVSFELPRGSITAVVGLNGVGKTTLIRILLGFLPPWSGVTHIAGTSPRHYRRRHGIGYLPESVRLPPGLSVSSFLAVGARLARVPEGSVTDAIARGLRMARLEGEARTLLTELSKGLARRAALAYALTGDPELVLLDEPESGLDPRSRVALRRQIRAAAEAGSTVLLSSHDLTEVKRLADQILVLDGGRMVRRLTSEDARDLDLEAELVEDEEATR